MMAPKNPTKRVEIKHPIKKYNIPDKGIYSFGKKAFNI
jgi:hypothetical protein